ncbi:transporter substrate-binding domain-containing protein [Stenotrophomonas rhizophila]|uniref:ATP-binding protein n=1 Tax=Stenotrophomonas rhizophila TaxID=216778 RepID=UPI002A69E226|nr:transporter substrate-binding domain-containing protein [Stenotrophomonas rhizophila]MDY0954880.1 transporter substrate-binding domain-containing protein [Stenotrophomonas rhizophila]
MRTPVVRWLLLIVLACVPMLAAGADAPATGPTLSPRQSEWLGRHPTIILGLYDSGWPPFESIRDGRLEGLGYDYMTLVAQRLGVQVEVRRYNDWSEVLDAACRGEVDVVMNITLTADRTLCMVYTRGYVDAPLAVVGRLDDTRTSTDPDLQGLRVVTERDFVTSTQVRARFPSARQVDSDDTLSALRMVAHGEADVYIGNAYVASALIRAHGLDPATLLRPSDLPPERLHFGVPHAKQPLAEAMDSVLAQLSQADRDALARRWLSPLSWSSQSRLILGNAEKRVLSRSLRMGFAPNAVPLAFIDRGGQPSGVAGDYLRQLRLVGAHLVNVPAYDWFEVREQARKGEVDVIMGVPNDSAYLGRDWVFSQPFITVPNVIVVGSDSPAVLGLDDLDGRSILLSDPDRLRGYVLQRAPNARIVPARSAEQALARLADGDADAYVGNLAMVDRLVRERYPAQLHVTAPAGFNDALSLAVRREYAPLATTFDRVLVGMTPREHEAIRSDWLAAEYRNELDWRSIARWAVPLALVLLTAILVHGWGHWRLRREVAMRRSLEQRLAEVTDNLPATVYQARRDSRGRFSFPYIAGDMEALFGLTVADAMADESRVMAQIDPQDRQRVRHALEQASRDFAPLDMEFRTSPHGDVRWVRSRALPYAIDDGAMLWSGYWVDVTEARAQADALAVAKAAAERAAAAKADFLATMSHEIRTPMSGVLGMVEVLSHTPLDGEQRRIIAVIEDSAQMLRHILDDILDYSRIEAGGLRLELQPVGLRGLLDNVRQLLSPQASVKGLALQLQVDPAVAPMHLGDGMRLRQIVFNLLSNAIKFTEQGHVSMALAVVREEDGAQWLRLAVTDSGIGISDEQRERLFKPFAQADAAISRQYGGTGLGLSICQRLVALMGGQLDLSSVPGEGTEVVVQLPLPVVPAAEPSDAVTGNDPAPDTLPETLRRRRILVVEDHPTNQALMRWRLQQLGLTHEVAVHGQAALDLLEDAAFDLVITDCRMPVLDGYAMTRRLRERERERGTLRMPVVALTASALAEDLQRCREAGMDDLLAKPVALATLRQMLLRWLPADGDAPVDATTASALPAPVPAAPSREAITQRFGSAHVADVMIQSMLSTTEDDLQRGQLARAQGDSATVGDVLHRIVGGLGTLGATTLAEQARALMQHVQEDGADACTAQLDAFEQDLRTYLALLQSA